MADALAGQRAQAISHRFVYPSGGLVPGVSSDEPKVYSKDAATGAVAINEPVQTYDVLNPPPAFIPTTADGTLTATNTTPGWTADEAYIVFSSTMTSGVKTDPAGKSHIWIAPAGGGTPIQLTSGNGNDIYPVLSPSNDFIAFVSDAGATGHHSLYVIPFNESTATASGSVPVAVSTLTSLSAKGGTAFTDVARPAWSASEDRIAFAASVTPSGTFQYNIYYLYVSTGGYLPLNSTNGPNPPGQLTSGPENDTDPAWSPDGEYIAFSSNAQGFTNTGLNSNPLLNETPCAATSVVASGTAIFVMTGGGTIPDTGDTNLTSTGGRITNTGNTDGGPAWSFNTSPFPGYIAFHRLLPQTSVADSGGTPVDTGQTHYQIAYFQVEASNEINNQPELLTEATHGSTIVNSSDVVDNGTVTFNNSFDDMYPTWSPMDKRLSIGYQSNRSITYNNPTTGAPSETPISLAPGTNAVGTAYSGIFVSEVDNVNPPTLLRFTGSEIVHVNAGDSAILPTATNPTGSSTRYVAPGTIVTFTVRLSNRESNTDSGNVYLQIKNPNSKYDDTDGNEHKLFSTDNPPIASTDQNDTDYQYPNGFYSNSQLYNGIVDVGEYPVGTGEEGVRGAVGGVAGATSDFGIGLDSSFGQDNGSGFPVESFRSWGPEYECQAVDPLYYAQSRTSPDPTNPNKSHLDALAADYYRPYYLAGFDDILAHQSPQLGDNNPNNANDPLPQKPGDTRSGLVKPVTWLKMTELPAAQQDQNGGLLYSVSWLTPQSQSDWYLDVIGYDNAKNWRIYDNVWGFTTQAWVGGNNILVVSDNTLGQKFAASTFNGVANLRPTMYGDESYYTGIDISKLPTAIYYYLAPEKPLTGSVPIPTIAPIQDEVGTPTTDPVLNALGQGSYTDGLIEPTLPLTGVSDAQSQQYNIWRVLSRGPVDQSVLMSYAPTLVTQPAVEDNGFNQPSAQFPIASKCVVWATPFTGDLLVGDGTFGSPTTQTQIQQFLAAGGRLFISGQDAGSTITVDGSINNNPVATNGESIGFLPADLGSIWQGTFAYSPTMTPATGAANRISHDGFFNDGSPYEENFTTVTSLQPFTVVYGPPSSYPNIVSNTVNQHSLISPDLFVDERSDGSMVDMTTDGTTSLLMSGFEDPLGLGNIVNGTMDDVLALSAAQAPTGVSVHNDYTDTNPGTKATSDEMVYYENVNNFSRVAYAPFDFGGFGIEYYGLSIPGGGGLQFYPHNFRPQVMHNIVTYLRSGTVTGTITENSGSGGGQVIAGATVYLLANAVPSPPGMPAGRTMYSGMTDVSGNYRIDGVESGSYTVVAYKPGFARATSTIGIEVEGDNVTALDLNMTAVPPGSVSGVVSTGTGANAVPVDGATVTLTVAGQSPLTGTTNASGEYTIDNVPGGAPPDGVSYTGVASKGTATSPTQTVDVISGQNTTANFTLPIEPAQISGVVSDSNGPISGATVTAVLSAGGASTTATTSSTGTYTLTGLAAGSYSVTASASGHFPSTVTQAVASGDALTLNFTLTIGTPTTLWGLVEGSAAGGPIGGVTVNVENSTGTIISTFVSSQTTSVGPTGGTSKENFSIGLAAGSYTLVPSVPGGTAVPVTVSGTNTNKNITVPTGIIGGLVNQGPNSGAAVGATVTITDTSGNVIATATTTAAAPPTIAIKGTPASANYQVELQPTATGTTYNVAITGANLISPPATTGVTVTANTWTVVNMNFQVLFSFSAGLHMVSVPYDYSTAGWGLFGLPASGPAYIWEQQPFEYVSTPTPPADAPHPGYGYWVKLTTGADIKSIGTVPSGATVNIPLNAGWNMIGVPSSSTKFPLPALPVDSITFANQADPSNPISFVNASSSLYNLVSPTLYAYDNTTNSYDITATAGGTLAPWSGYWIFAMQACTIQLPTSVQ